MEEQRRKRYRKFVDEHSFIERKGLELLWWLGPLFKDQRHAEFVLERSAHEIEPQRGLGKAERVLQMCGHHAVESLIVNEIGEPLRSLARAVLANDPDIRQALEGRGKYVGRSTQVASPADIEAVLAGSKPRIRQRPAHEDH